MIRPCLVTACKLLFGLGHFYYITAVIFKTLALYNFNNSRPAYIKEVKENTGALNNIKSKSVQADLQLKKEKECLQKLTSSRAFLKRYFI